ncbi:uncharacterized protein LOC126375199 isoform X2 [Pectinophora gossypiella]|nr:uncharacterized protein LOC126375199 isoform X2 [Pectinophora gossypiella]
MFSNNNRTRRYSHGSGGLSPLAAPVNVANSWGRATPRDRLNQLRAEECADVSNTREVAHEREIHNAMQMGQSCEDLTLVPGLANSPTRLPRFSPSPSVVSPSPTRKYQTTRRSLSPTIAIRASSFSPVSLSRPNQLVGKRRCDEADSPLSKRMCTSDRLTPSTPGTPDSDSLECTFRPVSPRAQPMNESPHESQDAQENHKTSPS